MPLPDRPLSFHDRPDGARLSPTTDLTRTGSAEAVQGLFPVLFVTLFLSSMSLPRNLIHTVWFREVATYNPVSYLIEAIRSLLISGWDGQALALGFGIAGAIALLAMLAATSALKGRLART